MGSSDLQNSAKSAPLHKAQCTVSHSAFTVKQRLLGIDHLYGSNACCSSENYNAVPHGVDSFVSARGARNGLYLSIAFKPKAPHQA